MVPDKHPGRAASGPCSLACLWLKGPQHPGKLRLVLLFISKGSYDILAPAAILQLRMAVVPLPNLKKKRKKKGSKLDGWFPICDKTAILYF